MKLFRWLKYIIWNNQCSGFSHGFAATENRWRLLKYSERKGINVKQLKVILIWKKSWEVILINVSHFWDRITGKSNINIWVKPIRFWNSQMHVTPQYDALCLALCCFIFHTVLKNCLLDFYLNPLVENNWIFFYLAFPTFINPHNTDLKRHIKHTFFTENGWNWRTKTYWW